MVEGSDHCERGQCREGVQLGRGETEGEKGEGREGRVGMGKGKVSEV